MILVYSYVNNVPTAHVINVHFVKKGIVFISLLDTIKMLFSKLIFTHSDLKIIVYVTDEMYLNRSFKHEGRIKETASYIMSKKSSNHALDVWCCGKLEIQIGFSQPTRTLFSS